MVKYSLKGSDEVVVFEGKIMKEEADSLVIQELNGKAMLKRNILLKFTIIMYHALDSIRGILDFQRFVQGDGYEFIEVSEFRAVYFENQIRKASGVSYRTHYREDHTGPGVLDSQGEPIMIPSACL